MDIEQARSKVAALKPGDQFVADGNTLEITSASNGTIEFCRPEYKSITGAYHRVSAENLAESFASGRAA